jgi:hypothetical protein
VADPSLALEAALIISRSEQPEGAVPVARFLEILDEWGFEVRPRPAASPEGVWPRHVEVYVPGQGREVYWPVAREAEMIGLIRRQHQTLTDLWRVVHKRGLSERVMDAWPNVRDALEGGTRFLKREGCGS